MTINISNTWRTNLNEYFENIDEKSINNFRSVDGFNKKLTSWSPTENSSRWFKYFLHSIIEKKSSEFFELYSKLNNTNLGNPISLQSGSLSINLDYLLAVDEYQKLMIINNFNKIKDIVEIGAGFGRTCHCILDLNNNIESYIIVDLPNMIDVSKIYLKKVLDKQKFNKIKFISCHSDNYKNLSSDLVININSFQEMTTNTIEDYMNNIIQNSKYFYCRNAICKYQPEQFDITNTKVEDVFELGLCQQIIDIFNKEQLDKSKIDYVYKYRPSENWTTIHNSDDIFSFYYNVIYKKNE